ncbi:MAG: tyrosine-type recombinase/integrase, partial [Actinomycetia bacterium]|nr:tyrosine-type recombinase/integrase [Actinomycetes bacterium]
ALATHLAPIPLVDATAEHILPWHPHLAGPPETIAAHISAARGLYRWMAVYARPRLRQDDPTVILERPHIPTAQPRPMLDRHYDLALACAVSDPEMYLWLGLMGCSGLRCCEIAWMHTGDVEPLDDHGALLHITGKGGKRRTVPAGAMLALTMRPFLTGMGPVFTRPSDGRAHTPNAVSHRVSAFLADVGIPAPHRAHSLRHRFGTDYHAIDPDLYRQAKLMGHSSVDTTQRYTEISPVEAARYVEQLTRRRLASRHVTGTRSGDTRRSGHAA